MKDPIVVVHGGAWAIPDELRTRSVEGVKRAAREGYRILRCGGTAVDAVVGAVTVLEDDTAFDAGHGAVLNQKGEVELDAIVVDGKNLNSGAVCGLQDVGNPVHVARLVMDKTDHCLLAGQGANDFAREQGIPRLTPDDLVTPEAKAEWQKYMTFSYTVNDLFSTRNDVARTKLSGCDTVGAVAMDASGNLASATSTGGITAKIPGRVGDSPLIGAGAYADNNVCAASSTGHGESIMKVCLTRRVGELMEKGQSAPEAAQNALTFMSERVGGAGGVIVISNRGEVIEHFTTSRMAWAWVKEEELSFGIDHGEHCTEPWKQE